MKIQNSQVLMNVNYFNLQFGQTDAKVSTDSTAMSNDKSSQLSKIQTEDAQADNNLEKLSQELTKALLKNLHSEVKSTKDSIEISKTYVEAEALDFQTKAIVQTEDKELEISLNVSLARSFVKKTSISIDLMNLKDPLVISLDGSMPSLSSKTFSFDIDSDGKQDQISELNRNSVFLVLDKNGNGVVDDGNELFGTQSGDGFGDLRKYDDDKNGWIDENDAIFDKLRVWQKNGNSNKLIALGEIGIGAIFLGEAKTQFSLKTDSNATLGEIRSSGMFLFEDGRAGIISHIDFAVDEKTTQNINNLENLTKKLSVFKLGSTYTSSTKETKNSDNRLEKLLSKLTTLQSKLLRATGHQKASIEADIAAIQSQILMIASH